MAVRKSYRTSSAESAESNGASRVTVAGIVAIAVDTVLNGGGMWSFVLNLKDTDSYEMLSRSLDFSNKAADAAAAAGGEMRMLPALAISLALGFVLSIAPHKLWMSAGAGQQARRRIAAVVAAAGGWATTWLFIQAIGLTGVWGVVLSLVVEWLLFEFKREVLR